MKVEDLRRLKLFAGVAEEDIRRLLRRYSLRRFRRRDFIFRDTDDIRRVFLMLSGTIKAYVYSPRGAQQIIHVFNAGDVFGGLIYGENESPRPWAQAVTDTVLVTLDDEELKVFMQHFPDVCLNVFRHLVEHHETHVRRMQTLIHTRARRRLALTLLHLGELQGDGAAARFRLPPFTHDDYAAMIGSVRSTVSEIMGELRRCGAVSGSRSGLTISRAAAERFVAAEREANHHADIGPA